MIIMAIVDEAVNDMEAVHILIILATDMVYNERKNATGVVCMRY
jgi:hypothetical protein